MKSNSVDISIIIATFNSAFILPKVLEALSHQTYPKNKLEILVLDGGSTDNTTKIAKSFGARVINNPRTEPVYAKYLGYKLAKGKHIVYLDHDEVLENRESLSLKQKILIENPSIKAVVGTGYKNPPHYPFINDYINEFGDPFSFFIYKLSKDSRFFIPTMKNRYKRKKETRDYILFDLSHIKDLPIIELCAAGSMLDAEYMKKEFPLTLESPDLIPHFFYLLYEVSPFLAISKNDSLIHYSSDTLQKYFKKILWRIKNNIYHVSKMGSAGFSGRQEFLSPLAKMKKYLFLPYAFSFIFPLYDALYLAITRKKILYFLHIPLTFYTAFEILSHTIQKRLGINHQLRSYDESKIVKIP